MNPSLPFLNIAAFVINLIGASIALSALRPIGKVAKMTRRRQVRRAWQALSLIILLCAGCHIAFTFRSLWTPLDTTGLLLTALNVLGPLFVCGVGHLSLVTAKDLVRIDQLEAAAKIDPLTGALNRFGFSDAVAAQQSRIGVIVADLDHFKRINDRLGHQAGDYVLRCFVDRTKRMLPKGSHLARFGGEEFVIALPAMDLEATLFVAERLRICASRSPADWPVEPISTTISVGVAVASSGDDLPAAIARADKALYEAKNGGRDQVRAA